MPDWSPDAVVPASGLPAWSEPDGSAPPATQLQGGVEVRIAERRGEWAKVECWNGWAGWLNGSLLMRRWSPTHVTPPGGLDAWPAPDPTRPPATHLGDGADLIVLEQRPNGWAQVESSNGWKGWVDGRRLVQRAAAPRAMPGGPPSGPPQGPPGAPTGPPSFTGPPGAPRPRVDAPFGITMPDWWPAEVPVVAAAGALLVLLGSILPWLTVSAGPFSSSASAWDLSVFGVLFKSSALSGLKVGLLLLSVLVVGLPALTKKSLPVALPPSLGLMTIVFALFTIIRASGASVGFGLFVSAAGGVVLALDWFRAGLARMQAQSRG